jgi:hypothetical protein
VAVTSVTATIATATESPRSVEASAIE